MWLLAWTTCGNSARRSPVCFRKRWTTKLLKEREELDKQRESSPSLNTASLSLLDNISNYNPQTNTVYLYISESIQSSELAKEVGVLHEADGSSAPISDVDSTSDPVNISGRDVILDECTEVLQRQYGGSNRDADIEVSPLTYPEASKRLITRAMDGFECKVGAASLSTGQEEPLTSDERGPATRREHRRNVEPMSVQGLASHAMDRMTCKRGIDQPIEVIANASTRGTAR